MPPGHKKVAPFVALEAVKMAVGEVQFSCAVAGETAASGSAKSALAEADSTDTQPFGPVAVTA